MATSNYSNPESLATLSAMVERTLIDTGRLFRKSGSMTSRTHLQRSIPSYYESFQEALDDLSEQIFMAKALLEKDHEAIKAKKAAPQLATKDVTMSDAAQKVESEAQLPPSDKIPGGPKIEPKAEEGVAVEQSAVPMERIPGAQADHAAAIKEEQDNAKTVPADQGLSSGAGGEVDFDSVLNDNTGGPNEFDIGLDFGNDDMGNEAFLSGSAFQIVGSTGGAGKSIEAPAGGGAFEMELQNTEGKPDQSQEQGNAAEDIMGPGESSFDDLFMETENFGEDATGNLNQLEGDSLMNINELDDNWFT